MIKDDVFLEIERRSQEQRARTHKMLCEAGRADLAIQLEKKYREIDNGTDGARATWHSISEAQRRVLTIMGTGRHLRQRDYQKSRYDAYGEPEAVGNVCSIATVRNLCARDLVHVDGGVKNPERKIVLTERGRFVLAYGPSPEVKT